MTEKTDQPSDRTTGESEARTAEEQAIIDAVAESRGEEFSADYRALILAQARLVGEL